MVPNTTVSAQHSHGSYFIRLLAVVHKPSEFRLTLVGPCLSLSKNPCPSELEISNWLQITQMLE